MERWASSGYHGRLALALRKVFRPHRLPPVMMKDFLMEMMPPEAKAKLFADIRQAVSEGPSGLKWIV